MVDAEDGAFATIFYDHGVDSDAMLLAIRVLMKSIRESRTKYRTIVIVPSDGLLPKNKALFLRDDPTTEIVRADIPNVFKMTGVNDPRAQLLHMRNKLVLWDDPVLTTLRRIVYLEPENLVMNNLDEIFACSHFCAVDNGQSIVYSNSLLVVSPESLAARNLYSDAIDAFMISGREYNYIGISQGFLPGLFEDLEESPLFIIDDGVDRDETDGDDGDDAEREEDAAFEREAAKSVVRRLPFYYSINHMAFYERLNWDLYQCNAKNKGSRAIPGPLLSFKYSGETIKPWFWLAYTYFQVNWHWQEVRERLMEDHVGFFVSKVVSQTVLFLSAWVAYAALCLKLRSEPNGRMRRLSSWGLPAPSNSEPLSMDILNSRVVCKACQFSCNVLYAVSSTPFISSVVLVFVMMYSSIHTVPPTMHPRYACMLWAYLLNSLILTVLIIYDIAATLRNVTWKKDEVPSALALFLDAFLESCKRMPVFLVVQFTFLYAVGRTDWFRNPVLRPTVLIALLALLCFAQVRLVSRAMIRVARK